jgi:hypothetical protein
MWRRFPEVLSFERLDGFQFLVRSIQQLMEQHELQIPDIAITDFDDATKTALAA